MGGRPVEGRGAGEVTFGSQFAASRGFRNMATWSS